MEGNGLGVILRYMNGVSASESQQDWVALRTVAELAFVSATTQSVPYPLLHIAASCGYLRSTDTFVGASHPLLHALSDPDEALGYSASPSSATRTLVEEFVAKVIHNAHFGAYPHLQLLDQVVADRRSASTTPEPIAIEKHSLPAACVPTGHEASSAISTGHEASSAISNDVARYPVLGVVQSACRCSQEDVYYPTLKAFSAEFVRTKVNVFETSTHGGLAEDDEMLALIGGSTSVAAPRNTAFMFTKPHAFGRSVQSLVESKLKLEGFRIERCGVMSTSRVDKEGIVDRHYAAIARYATQWKPADISLPDACKALFQRTFGEHWDACCMAGRVLNAKEACTRFGCRSGAEFAQVWGRYPRRVKLGPGLYVGFFDSDDVYVVNGFYLANRDKFTQPGGYLNWYVVSWESSRMSWKDFRGRFIGTTNPADAPAGSLRREILDHWQDLGLPACPSVSDNGIHASAGPLEGLAERLIWLPGHTLANDVMGRALTRLGVAPAFIARLLENPEVIMDGKKGLVFDLLEDTETTEACSSIAALQQRLIDAPNDKGQTLLTPLEVLSLGTTPLHKTLSILFGSPLPEPTAPSAITAGQKPSGTPLTPEPPTSVRGAKPTGRAVRSPYHYDRRSCGAGLEAVVSHTLSYASSKRFAQSVGNCAETVAAAFSGLRALHAAAVFLKKSTAPDPLLGLTTVVWAPSTKYAEVRHATLPPVSRVPKPPVEERTATSRRPEVEMHATTSAESSRRLSTADRIKKRTAKLQEEISELNRRHQGRIAQHQTPTKGTASRVSPSRTAWGTPRGSIEKKADSEPSPTKTLTKQSSPRDPLPLISLKPEQVKLSYLPKPTK